MSSECRRVMAVGCVTLSLLACKAESTPSPKAVVLAQPVADAATPDGVGEPQGSFLTNAVVTSTDIPNAEAVILGARPSFKRCYEATRSGSPHFGGMVTCSMRVDKDGHVAAVSVVRRDRLPDPMVDCLIAALKAAQFGPLTGDHMVVVPIRFADPDE